MCGIAGEFTYGDGCPVPPDILEQMCKALAHRGPDGSGVWLSRNEQIGFAHTRLAILDLTNRAAQPMHSANRRYSIVFNGEIYNFEDLRRELIARGTTLISTGDTEVLLTLYAEYGLSMLDKLRGMYAFAIWDETAQELIIARDPLGIKPLYYADDGKRLRFSSQVSGLLGHPGVDLSVDSAGHVGFFVWGSVPEPYTLYKGIRALPAGHWLRVRRDGHPHLCAFAQPVTAMATMTQHKAPSDRKEMQEQLHVLLRESVAYHLKSDVPVAIFQSAGLDSSVVTAMASEEHSNEVHALTLGFDQTRGSADDEVPLASEVTREYGVRHRHWYVDRETFFRHRERLFAAMDQPTIDGINAYFVSLLARQSGFKVALSGLGGDELFGGYPSFRQIPQIVHMLKFLPPGTMLGRSFRILSAGTVRRLSSPKYAGMLEYGGSIPGAYLLRRGLFMPWELPDFLDPDLVREGWARLASMEEMNQLLRPLDGIEPRAVQNFLKVSALETSLYMRNQLLRDADWAGMANSVEIRVPMVDFSLIRKLAPLRAGPFTPHKTDMAACLTGSLQQALVQRPKTGFTVPVREWIQEGEKPGERGFRGWAKFVYEQFMAKTVPTRTPTPLTRPHEGRIAS